MEAILFCSIMFRMLVCAFALYFYVFYSRSKQGKRNISRIRQRHMSFLFSQMLSDRLKQTMCVSDKQSGG